MAAASLPVPPQGSVTFEDVAVYFSWNEWCLLDEVQIRLYLDVMLENFALVCMLGSWRGVQDKETPSEEIKPAGVLQFRTPRAGLSPEKTQPCAMCIPVLRDILHLAEEQGTNGEQKAYTCAACGKAFYFTANIQQHQKQHVRENPFLCNTERPSFLKTCTVHSAGNFSTYMEIGNDFMASMGVQPQATNTGKKLNNSTECEVVFHSGESHHSLGEAPDRGTPSCGVAKSGAQSYKKTTTTTTTKKHKTIDRGVNCRSRLSPPATSSPVLRLVRSDASQLYRNSFPEHSPVEWFFHLSEFMAESKIFKVFPVFPPKNCVTSALTF